MFELIHAVIASLLLSAGMGFGTGVSSSADEETTDSESGVQVGSMPSHLLPPRGLMPSADDRDDDQPASASTQVSFCEPAIVVAHIPASALSPVRSALFPTAGRSP
ncbi:MAG: hypothetical protein ACPGYV_08595 [Phycisphaeraceae bacterium]